MRRLIQGLVLGSVISLVTVVSAMASDLSGDTLQFSITGTDRGVAFMTFSNNFTVGGYGVSIRSLAPFELTGTWTNGDRGTVFGTFSRSGLDGGESASFVGHSYAKGRFLAKAKTNNGTQTLKAPEPAVPPSVKNQWVAKGFMDNKKVLSNFSLTATNLVGWYNLEGTGSSAAGHFDLSGVVMVTSDLHAAAYTRSDFIVNDLVVFTTTAAYIGQLARDGKHLYLAGYDDNGKRVVLKATGMP